MITIEIAYAPDAITHEIESLEVLSETCVSDAISQSKLLQLYPEIRTLPAGIFGVRVDENYELSDGDRLEVYRPLTIDPMQKRKNRASEKRG